ncbi:MAG: hypothetical protein RML56_09215 [Burkholderiales bacterium]|nr:hypothetical protein [Burkholderiales bacterium]MDW8469108.1 hypothetical protein [Burkholderiales bacterium]
MLDPLRVARIGKHSRHRIEQPQAMLEPAQQQQATVAGDIAAVEIYLDTATTKALKRDSLRRTIWHRRTPR